MIDQATVELIIKSVVGIVFTTGFTRFLKKLDKLENALVGVQLSLQKITIAVRNNEKTQKRYFKRYDILIELLRKRDHAFFNMLQELRWQGELHGWSFPVKWDLPAAYDAPQKVDEDDEEPEELDEDDPLLKKPILEGEPEES